MALSAAPTPCPGSGSILRKIASQDTDADSLGDTSTLADPSVVDTLISSLTYTDGSPFFVEPIQPEGEPYVWRYSPPDSCDEFMLERVEMPDDGAGASLPAAEGLQIVLVVKGTVSVEQLDDVTEDAVGLRHTLRMGAVHLVCPHTRLRLRASGGPVLLFRAQQKPVHEDIDTGLTLA